MKYKVSVSITRTITADSEEEAEENFWGDLEEDNDIENTTTENRLTDSMVIKKIGGK